MINLYIMTQKGYDVLCHIARLGYISLVDMVICSTDNSIEKDYYSEIKSKCLELEIPFYDRKTKVDVNSQYSIAISWRWIIANDSNLIVLHDSILPKYRGFAPLVNSLKNGDEYIGVTALFASAEYDRGDIICSEKIKIQYPIKINKAIDLIGVCYSKCVENIMHKLSKGELIDSVTQNESDATYSLWLDDLDYQVDWNKDSEYIKRFIDSVGWPYAGAYTIVGVNKFRILDVELVDDVYIENRAPGKVIFLVDNYPVVVCGKGLIKIRNMVSIDGVDALPLKKFRTRFI